MNMINKITGVIVLVTTTMATIMAQPPSVDTTLINKATEWVSSLKLNDDAKAQKVKNSNSRSSYCRKRMA